MGMTTNKTSDYGFVSLFELGSNVRHFAARLLNETRTEATEANIAVVALECGVTESERDDVIGAALDHGLVRSTQLESRLCDVAGLRSVACLVRA
jgi:hypothetical protein